MLYGNVDETKVPYIEQMRKYCDLASLRSLPVHRHVIIIKYKYGMKIDIFQGEYEIDKNDKGKRLTGLKNIYI